MPNALVTSKLPPTSNYVPILHYNFQHLWTSTSKLQFPGPSLPGEPLQGSHISIPATTRSFLSSVAVPVAPFELQPAPSTLQLVKKGQGRSRIEASGGDPDNGDDGGEDDDDEAWAPCE
ncbi:hypothetical protein F5051DRAFT_433499 [Lentinula edodes]|nr:hypothetical protein F5051DRAFT_433499 [Lentinula edodes]